MSIRAIVGQTSIRAANSPIKLYECPDKLGTVSIVSSINIQNSSIGFSSEASIFHIYVVRKGEDAEEVGTFTEFQIIFNESIDVDARKVLKNKVTLNPGDAIWARSFHTIGNAGTINLFGLEYTPSTSGGTVADLPAFGVENAVLTYQEPAGATWTPGILNAHVSSAAAIAHSKLANLAGLSVLGRSANSAGAMAAITGADGQVLRVSGTTLGFGTIAYAALPTGASGAWDVGAGNILTLTRQVTFGDADTRFNQALVALGGGAAATLGTIGGSGPAAAGQDSWKKFLDSAGVAFYVPAWK